ncbi:NAD-dependent epimerase/dehydratase family protein [Desulfoplanes formicivorans]|uniref:NAD-dependent dehydratase n=1 Tax=Desulfoplanes formicivorans TaxID=1592317 RepID=A0A194AKT1_9BACT|nr:NAD-dependent epimerase/dehydratase family protein [Desulfoplanes formicivorans]GAU09923.1 NAD-dependent dehydratase [Desulfoplanes formicivorans]
MKQVLLTGANGFIGQVLVRMLKDKGCRVTALLRKEYKGAWDDALYGDIRTPLSFPELPSCDTVFHLAGKAHALSEHAGEEDEYHTVNTQGTRHVLELAKKMGATRFIYFSSIKAMGEIGHNDNETSPCNPKTPYGISKYEAEQLVLFAGYVSHPVVIRPTMVYGPGAKGYLPQLIRFIQKGIFPPLSPSLTNKRSMVHVNDLVQAAILAAEDQAASGQVFIVSDGKQYSTYDIYAAINQALGKKLPGWSLPQSVLCVAARIGDGIGRLRGRRFLFDSDVLHKMTGSAWYDTSKSMKELGFTPQWDLPSALPEILEGMKP